MNGRDQADRLEALYGALPAQDLIERSLRDLFPGRVAIATSFGTESAVLLHLIARVDPATPVLFLDTGKHFPETLDYRDRLIARLGLSRVLSVRPAERHLGAGDPSGTLWSSDPDRCCEIRKVLPLEQALAGYDGWISGRKRYHGETRAVIRVFEPLAGRIQVNPLASWGAEDVERAFRAHDLPRHPLWRAGYRSVGCATCTAPTPCSGTVRDGRWTGREKTECGIHWPTPASEGALGLAR